MQIRDRVPARVVGDCFRLEHVLGNLLSNAVKFSDFGSQVTIDISFGTKLPHHVTFSVIDNGMGMTPSETSVLFQPFVQIRAGELQKGRGSGLGLTICKKLVELHGGVIGCVSRRRNEEGANTSGGSQFFFSIKFEKAPEEQIEVTTTNPPVHVHVPPIDPVYVSPRAATKNNVESSNNSAPNRICSSIRSEPVAFVENVQTRVPIEQFTAPISSSSNQVVQPVVIQSEVVDSGEEQVASKKRSVAVMRETDSSIGNILICDGRLYNYNIIYVMEHFIIIILFM